MSEVLSLREAALAAHEQATRKSEERRRERERIEAERKAQQAADIAAHFKPHLVSRLGDCRWKLVEANPGAIPRWCVFEAGDSEGYTPKFWVGVVTGASPEITVAFADDNIGYGSRGQRYVRGSTLPSVRHEALEAVGRKIADHEREMHQEMSEVL